MIRLINPKQLPKNGYTYIQPETGFKIGGQYSFRYVVNAMVAHRKSNNLARATFAECAEDLDAYTCNISPELCYDSNVRVAEQVRQSRGCGSCGIKVA